MQEHKSFSYMIFIFAVVCFVIGLKVTKSKLFFLLGLLLNLLALIFYNFGSVIISAIFPGLKMHPAYKTLEIVDDVVVMEVAGGYLALAYLEVLLKKSVKEMSDSENIRLIKNFDGFLTSIRVPLKITTLVYPMNVQEVRKKIRRRRDMKLLDQQEAEAKGDKYKVQQLEDEIEKLDKILERLERENIFETISYVAVAAMSSDKATAIENAKQRRKDIETSISLALSADVRPIPAADLISILSLEALTPPESMEGLKYEKFF